jgi:hypothetical protein
VPVKDRENKKAYMKAYNLKNRERRRAYKQSESYKMRKLELAQIPSNQFKNAARYAKRRQIKFILSFDDFITERNKPCFYCGNRIGPPTIEGTGLDRIDNNKGYEPGNIVSCCKVCNQIKGDILTIEETKAAISAILSVRYPVLLGSHTAHLAMSAK